MDNCQNCKFYKEHQGKWKCKRFPLYTSRKKEDWCGEHERIIVGVKPPTKDEG